MADARVPDDIGKGRRDDDGERRGGPSSRSGGLLKKLILFGLVLVLGLAGWATWTFEQREDRWPSSGEDAREVVRIAWSQLGLAYREADERIRSVDWEALASQVGETITDQTQDLWERAEQQVEGPAEPPVPAADEAAERRDEAPEGSALAVLSDEAYATYFEEYQRGYEKMREGAEHYRKVLPGRGAGDQANEELLAAKEAFEASRDHLLRARTMVEDAGGEPDAELEETIRDVGEYIHDCGRMMRLRDLEGGSEG